VWSALPLSEDIKHDVNFSTIALLLSCCAVTAWAESAVTDLAEVTGTNIGLVSAKLSEHQQGINAIALKRIDLIASIERMAAEGRLNVDREVAILKQTGGADLRQTTRCITHHADRLLLRQRNLTLSKHRQR